MINAGFRACVFVSLFSFLKKIKKVLAINKRTTYNYFLSDGLSPSGKATDSDSVIT